MTARDNEYEGGACHDDTREERLDAAMRDVASYVSAGGLNAPECFNPAWLAQKTCSAIDDIMERCESLRAQVAALEAEIARLKTPEYALGEAERLARAAGVKTVRFDGPPNDFGPFVELWTVLDPADREDLVMGVEAFDAATLAEAFAKLRGEAG